MVEPISTDLAGSHTIGFVEVRAVATNSMQIPVPNLLRRDIKSKMLIDLFIFKCMLAKSSM